MNSVTVHTMVTDNDVLLKNGSNN